MELHQLFREIRRNWIAAIAAFAICMGIGAAAALLPMKQYKATATLLTQPVPNSTDPVGAVAVLQYIVPQLPTEATDGVTVNAARNLVPSQDAAASVTIDAASDPGTGLLTIDATSANPNVSAAFANAVAHRVQAIQPKGALYDLLQISPAAPPGSPDNPSKPILLAAGGFGVILAVFAALGAAGIRRRRSRVTEIKERIGASVLGEIPRVTPGGMRPLDLFASGRQPVAMEAFQELRSNLLFVGPSGRPALIAVTSCGPGEGKTSIASNLGWALAADDHPVTMVDGDLRDPSLHLMLDVPFGPGLSSEASYALEYASLTKNPNLQVIPAGISDRHPSDVMSANLPQLLDALRTQQDTVIVDCPPLIGAAETILIAALVDVVIVVVDTRRYNAERLQQCILRLEASGSAVVGVVLNRVRFGRRRRKDIYQYAQQALTSQSTADSLEQRPKRTAVPQSKASTTRPIAKRGAPNRRGSRNQPDRTRGTDPSPTARLPQKTGPLGAGERSNDRGPRPPVRTAPERLAGEDR